MLSFFRLALCVSLLTFMSCSKKDDSKSAQQQDNRPHELSFSIPTPGTPLTQDQVNQIKAVFSQKPGLQLPPSDLLLMDPNSKLNDDQLAYLYNREQELQYTSSPETWALYQAMRQNCHKQHGTYNLDVTFPLEKITDVTDLKTGDHLMTTAWGDYGGTGCDADVSGKATYEAKMEHLDTDGLATADASYSLNALMKNPKYAQLLNSKGIIATSSISGVVAKQNVNIKDQMDMQINLNFDVNGSYFTLAAEIPVDSSYSIYAKPVNELSAELQIEINSTVKMPTFTANVIAQVVSIVYKDNSAPTETKSTRYFVNGYEKTVPEIQALFGDNLNSQKAADVIQTFVN